MDTLLLLRLIMVLQLLIRQNVQTSLGIDVIITDHHRPHGHVPDAYAIVNPNQDDCPYPYKKFAGVGVTFKVLSLLYEQKGLDSFHQKYMNFYYWAR